MASNFRGDPIHGEATIAGPGGDDVAITLYPAGSVTAKTIDDDETVFITDLIISSTTGNTIGVYADGAAAGEYVFVLEAAATGVYIKHFVTPYECQAGVTPHFIVDDDGLCQLQGFVCRVK